MPIFITALVLLASVTPLLAQEETAPIRGRVTSMEGQPLSGATIHALDSYWTSISGREGYFELVLPAGSWQLEISRIGYRSDTVAVAIANSPPEPLTIALAPAPVALRGLTVDAPRAAPLSRTVTTETVRQVPPLGEPDIFRALVLLPGVSQPNDLKGRIHLAGGSSDETGIRLDGHPLQDPFHLLGLFGAFNVAALERADVLVHHLPSAFGGRLSGVINLTTRLPGSDPAGEVVASLLTSGATLSYPDLPAGLDLLASGRITYLDRVMPLFYENFPALGFHDALLRLGRSWGDDWRAEVIGFNTRDYFRDSDFVDAAVYEPFTWGESLVGVRLDNSGGLWDILARASFNRAFTHLDERPFGGSTFIESQRDWASAALELTRTGRNWRLEGGVSIDHRSNDNAWVARGLVNEVFSPNTPEVFTGEETQTVVGAFGGVSRDWGERWTARAGARLSTMAGGLYLAPRVALGFDATDELQFEAALNRRYQFNAQLEEPLEGSVTAPLFLLEEPRTANVAALAAEWTPKDMPIARAGSFRAQAFYKHYPDRPRLPAPKPGQTRTGLSPRFPEFQRFRGHAWGAMMSGKLAFGNEGILQGSYTFQRVREEFAGNFYPTAWDAPHTVALFGSMPIWGGWAFNSVYHAHSGRATTPVLNRIFEPDLRGAGSLFLLPRYLFGERNSIRVPPYHRIDLGVRKTWNTESADWTLSLQILNILNNDNPIGYDWRVYFSDLGNERESPRTGRSGLPFLPSIGLEVKW